MDWRPALLAALVVVAALYMCQPTRRIAETSVRFALVGPFVGTVLFALLITIMAVAQAHGADRPVDALGMVMFMLAIGVPFGYVIGIVPAALTGATVGLLPAGAPKVARFATALVAGAVTSLAWTRSLFGHADEAPLLLVALAAIGAIAAVVCARMRRDPASPRPIIRPVTLSAVESAAWTGRNIASHGEPARGGPTNADPSR